MNAQNLISFWLTLATMAGNALLSPGQSPTAKEKTETAEQYRQFAMEPRFNQGDGLGFLLRFR